MTTTCIDTALDLASRGFAVFPCVPGKKKPCTEHGFKDASNDPAVIRAWWEQWPDANVAIATDGLVIIDVDVDAEKGRAENLWLADQPDLLAELSAAPSAMTPRGGRHYFFQQGSAKIRCSAGDLAEGVDVRAGGGYLVVAPSRTNRGQYRFVTPLPQSSSDLPMVPAWLEKMIATAKEKPATASRNDTGPIPEGSRNDHLTSLGGRLRRKGLEQHEILARLLKANDERCAPPLDAGEVEAIAASVANYPVGHAARDLALREVMIKPDEHRVNDEVVEALIGDADLFQRGGRLVRAIPRGGVDPTMGGLIIQEIEPPTLREIITRRAQLYREGRDGEPKEAHPPTWLVAAIHGRGFWKGVRHLHAVAESPVLRPDGSVVQAPGYDAVTGVLYEPKGEFPPVPEFVNRDDAWAAVESLCEIVEDFKFESEVHRSAWIAMVLTVVGRHAFEGPTPLFLIDANVRGAGKSLLAQVGAMIALGHVVPTTSYSHDADELRKQISMTALEGDPMVVFDNLAGNLGNDALDRALTSTRWRVRRLGSNSKVDAPLVTTWAATGNNVAIDADTARRTLHIRLSVPDERPEDRSGFKHTDLLAFVREQRPKLFMAAITILGVYLRDGCPDQSLRPMGSYEGWSRVVRGALAWCGQPDPCLGRDGLEIMADGSAEAGRNLVAAWRAYFPDNRGVAVANLVRDLYPQGGSLQSDQASVAMRAALEQLIGTGKPPTSRTVGNKLKTVRDRVFDGWCLSCDTTKSAKGRTWRLRHVDGDAAVTLVTVPDSDLKTMNTQGAADADAGTEAEWFDIDDRRQ
jgi:hypothetical protein